MRSREELIKPIIQSELKNCILPVWVKLIQDDWMRDDLLWYNQSKYRFYLWSMWYVMHYEKGYTYTDIRFTFDNSLSYINYGLKRVTNVVRKPHKNEEEYRIYIAIKELLS